jgi:hypothetical protein
MEDPKQDHMAALKHVLRYVAASIDYGLMYTEKGEFKLLGYSDSDMAGDVDDRRSTTGVIFFLGGNPVIWTSQKQKSVANSSREAEYMVAATSRQAVWLQRLVDEVTGIKVPAPVIRMDNTAAIALAKNPVLHDRSKHIDVKFHFTRECYERGDIELEHMGTNDKLADALTKLLGKVRFQELRE